MKIFKNQMVTGFYNDSDKIKVEKVINSILHPRVGGLSVPNCYSKVYIGYSCDPERRSKEHAKEFAELFEKEFPYNLIYGNSKSKRPDEVIILFKSSKSKDAREMEKYLIQKYAWSRVNDITKGGVGRPCKNPPYYVYLLLEKRANFF